MKQNSFNPAIGFYFNEAATEKTFVSEGTHIHQFTRQSWGDEAYYVVDKIDEVMQTVYLSHTVIRSGHAECDSYSCSITEFREMVDGYYMEAAYSQLHTAMKIGWRGCMLIRKKSKLERVIAATTIPADTRVSVSVMTLEDCERDDRGEDPGEGRAWGNFIQRNISYREAEDICNEQQERLNAQGYVLLCIYRAGTTDCIETHSLG